MKAMRLLGSLLLITTLFALSPLCRADALNGQYTLDFTGNESVWDISGTYFETLSSGELETEYTINQDADGKLSGSGTFTIDAAGAHVDGFVTIGGKVTGGAVTRVTLILTFDGTGSGPGFSLDITAKATTHSELDRALREFMGRVQVRACATASNGTRTARRCRAAGEPFSSSVPDPNMDGSLTFQFDVATTNTTVTGTAQATLSNGGVYDYTVAGTFNTRRNISTLLFTPAAGSAAITLRGASATAGALTAGNVRGAISGQKINGRIP